MFLIVIIQLFFRILFHYVYLAAHCVSPGLLNKNHMKLYVYKWIYESSVTNDQISNEISIISLKMSLYICNQNIGSARRMGFRKRRRLSERTVLSSCGQCSHQKHHSAQQLQHGWFRPRLWHCTDPAGAAYFVQRLDTAAVLACSKTFAKYQLQPGAIDRGWMGLHVDDWL